MTGRVLRDLDGEPPGDVALTLRHEGEGDVVDHLVLTSDETTTTATSRSPPSLTSTSGEPLDSLAQDLLECRLVDEQVGRVAVAARLQRES